MALYERNASDMSVDLFNSVYTDLFNIAMRQQRGIWQNANANRPRYYVGDAQDMLTGFCVGRVSLGEALDYIREQNN